MSSTEELIGRADVNDLEAILAITNTDVDEVIHAVADNADAIFTWDYDAGPPGAAQALREGQDRPVERRDRPAVGHRGRPGGHRGGQRRPGHRPRSVDGRVDFAGTPFEKWGDKEWLEFGIESQNWTLSQFMHGEQGALMCTAKIVETVPWIDAKYYASTQVMDEARHVEVFAKYLDTKLSGHYPINAHLRMLLDDIVNDSRWDMTYLGMQIMVEGLALAAFGFMHQMTTEPLLKQLLRYVMSDEARHVAFGVLVAARSIYDGLTTPEIRERQEFAFEAAVRMRDRFLQQEVWDRMGVEPAKDASRAMLADPDPPGVPADAVLEDRPELQEARPARRRRRLAARPLRRARRDPVRGLGRHRRGVRRLRPRPGSQRRRPAAVVAAGTARDTVGEGRRQVRYAGCVMTGRFGGVLTAMVTPFDDEGALDLDAAARPGPVGSSPTGNDGLVVAGTTGESPVLTDDERLDAARPRSCEAVDVPVVAGTGTNDTAHSVHLTAEASQARRGRHPRRRRRTTTGRRRPASTPTSGRSPRPPTCR